MTRRWIVRSGPDLGRALSGLRQLRGMTQAELAAATGIERTYLARLEAGHATRMVDRLVEAVRALGAELVVVDQGDG